MDKGWGLWSGAGRGLGDDGGLDQGYELVLGMRLCAQCWEYRGEQQSGDVCMVGQTWKHTDMGDTDAEIHEHGNIQSWQHTEWEHADVGTGRCRHQNKTLTKQCFQAVCKDLLFQCNLFYCILFF